MAKKHKHPEHVNNERWLVSYADFITLLFAFFVVLFSSSQVDRSKTNKMSLAIQAAFSSFSIFKERAGKLSVFTAGENGAVEEQAGKGRSVILSKVQMPLKREDTYESILLPAKIEYLDEGFIADITGDEELSSNAGYLSSEEQALAKAQRDIMGLLEKKKFKNKVSVRQDERGVVLSIRDIGLFENGDEILSPQSKELLSGLGYILSIIPNQIRIEGHSDNQTPTNLKYESNWELSVFRSTFIVRWLIKTFNLDPTRFVAVGYGEYRPIADNATEEGRKLNRRIDIILLTERSADFQQYSSQEFKRIPLTVEMPVPENKENLQQEGEQDKSLINTMVPQEALTQSEQQH